MAVPEDMADRFRLRPMIVRQVTLLPEPDSPTMPRVWPLSTLNETPSTARTTPSSVLKYVFRSLTSSSAISRSSDAEKRARAAPGVLQGGPSLAKPNTWVDHRVQQVDQQVERDDAEGREHDHPLLRRQVEILDCLDRGLAEPLQPVD